jgi:hypothetical protein
MQRGKIALALSIEQTRAHLEFCVVGLYRFAQKSVLKKFLPDPLRLRPDVRRGYAAPKRSFF